MVGLATVLVAAVLGSIALAEARKATHWAKTAAQLQERANELSEAGVAVAFRAGLHFEVFHDGSGDGQPFDSWLELKYASDLSAVFVHGVETLGAYGGSTSEGNWLELLGHTPVEPRTDSLPRQLHPGESIDFANPWNSFGPTTPAHSWARVRVFFSVTATSSYRSIVLDVLLPPPAVEPLIAVT